jgi:hypothetical protein
MKALHYTDVANIIRDFVLNQYAITEKLYVEVWNYEDTIVRLETVEFFKEDNIITALFRNGEQVETIGQWTLDTDTIHRTIYDEVYSWVANLHKSEYNYFFAVPEISGVHAARGDSGPQCYAIANKVCCVGHNDWCLFDERGYLGVDAFNVPVCYIAQSVAEHYAEIYFKHVSKWAMPLPELKDKIQSSLK